MRAPLRPPGATHGTVGAAIRRLAVALLVGLALARGEARAQRPSPEPEPAAALRIIVHPTTPVTALAREDAARLFLKRVTRWQDGTPVVPVDLGDEVPVRLLFTRLVHKRSIDMLLQYWQRQIFAGRETPPLERPTEAAVVAFVRSTPGAVGYVSAAVDLRGVRVVSLRLE